jgi:hypothetical protein
VLWIGQQVEMDCGGRRYVMYVRDFSIGWDGPTATLGPLSDLLIEPGE